MLLLELFDRNDFDIEWRTRSDHLSTKYTASFMIDNLQYVVEIEGLNNSGKFYVGFYQKTSMPGLASKVYKQTNNTGTKSIIVFSKVIQILVDFINKHKPKTIQFSGDKSEGRDILYKKIIDFLKKRYSITYRTNDDDDDMSPRQAFIIDFNQ